MRQTPRRRTRAATGHSVRAAALASALLLLAGCGGTSPQPAGPSGSSSSAESGVGTVPFDAPIELPSETAAPTPPLGDPLEGTWWVLAPSLPYMAFRANLVAPPDEGDELQGSWVSFDWRRTNESSALVRLSKPVAIHVERDGDMLSIAGPAPMLDASGNPNGHSGNWSLSLQRISLPGEPAHYSGRSRHSRLTEPEGTPVEFVRDFRPWKKP